MKYHLVGDWAQLHGDVSAPGQLFGEGVVRQSVAVADPRGVEQQRVQNVLIHVRAFVVCVQNNATLFSFSRTF